LWIGGIHGDEPEGDVATAELPAALVAAGLVGRVTVTILEDDNPDGRAHGTHDNANGVDLNRNFPSANFDATNPTFGRTPLSQPESRVLSQLFAATRPQLVIVCHAFEGAQFINYDGPARVLAARFAALSPLPVRASDQLGYPTPGSLGSFVGLDHHVPILTIEWLEGTDPSHDWQQTRRAILAVIAA
jgi:hypothetical protein